ncbi:MAG TPA: hypothetical protein VIN08_22605 [Ohtaekwangia sp.]|uniref:hypothetical protein n=1 Tax=Ohtaekwangia sp. TaxID=2066019 RepID=UPI002F957392
MEVKRIPFEIHLTVEASADEDVVRFMEVCLLNNGKPLLIELSRGDYAHQPMFSSVIHAASLEQALISSRAYIQSFTKNSFPVKRLKIEVPSVHAADAVYMVRESFKPYYEWHGKVNYERVPELIALCEKHRVHLSLNALRGESTRRFVTLRDFDTEQIFNTRVANLKKELNEQNWYILKEQSEFCIYDDNIVLDNGWLV